MRLFAFLLASGLIGVTAASAQMTGTSCPVVPHRGLAALPYSLVRLQTQVQTLSNGVQITTRMEMREWRDAENRTRYETWVERNGEMELQNGSINDPVLREAIMLHPKSHVAQVIRFPEPAAAANQQRPVDKAFQEAMKPEYQVQQTSRIENKSEALESTVIAGECAQGIRWTSIIPAGEMGNDGEIRTVSEGWMSPRLGIQLRWVTDDPRSGHTVNEVTELHLEAPDPSVFQPPPDYQVFDLTWDPAKP